MMRALTYHVVNAIYISLILIQILGSISKCFDIISDVNKDAIIARTKRESTQTTQGNNSKLYNSQNSIKSTRNIFKLIISQLSKKCTMGTNESSSYDLMAADA